MDEIEQLSDEAKIGTKNKEILEPYLNDVQQIYSHVTKQIDLIKDMPEWADSDQLEQAFQTLASQLGVLKVSKIELATVIESLNGDEVKQLVSEGYKIELSEKDGKIVIEAVESDDVPATVSTPDTTTPVQMEKTDNDTTSKAVENPDKIDVDAILTEDFLYRRGGGKERKSFKELSNDLVDLFVSLNIPNEEIDGFMSSRVGYYFERVKAKVAMKNLLADKGKNDGSIMDPHIEEQYRMLLLEASNFAKFDTVDKESGTDDSLPVESSEGEVLEAIEQLRGDFNQINSAYSNVLGYKESKEFKAVNSILQALKDYQANIGGSGDKKDQKRRLEKYQNKLSKAVADLATFVGTLPTPDSGDRDVAADVSSEAEVTARGMAPLTPPEHITVIDPSVDDILDNETVGTRDKKRFSNDDVSDVEPKVVTSLDIENDEPVDFGPEIILEPEVDQGAAERVPDVDPLAAFNTEGLELAPIEETSSREVQYEKSTARSEWREAMKNYRAVEMEYQSKLSAYYGDSSWKTKAGRALFAGKKLIGLNPDLPPPLDKLKSDYEETRALYAKSLDAALLERGKFGTNQEYAFDAKTKLAFASKFIIKPHEKILKAQEVVVSPSEEAGRIQKTMAFLSKHKWHTRLGVVATAGIVGGLTGGVGLAVAGASWQAWKIAASAASGAVAGKSANWATGFLVNKAETNLKKTTDSIKGNFNLDDISDQSARYEESFKKVTNAKTVQKTATVGAAVAAGGLTGYGLGQLPEGYVSLVSEAVNVEPFATNIAIPYSGREGGYEHVISNLNLGEDFDPSALPDGKAAEIEKFLRVKISDYLDANVNMSEAKLEANLMSVLERKFGSESWWTDADIKKVDIGDIVLRKIEAAQNAGTVSATPSTEVPASNLSPFDGSIKPEYAYEVVKGDTLGEIILDKFKLQTNGFSEAEKGELLARAFAKLEANPDLVKQLGLRSGDIDLIYPGEKLNLEVLHDLIDKEGERMTILEDFRKSAPLTVEAEAGVKNVPITVVEKPIPGGRAVTFEDATYTEAAPSTPEKPSIPVAPKITPLNGQYLDHPAYKEYLTKVFGSEDQAMREVLKSAKDFDATTYDVFDGMKGYESPYTFLGEQKLKDFDGFVKQNPAEIRSFLSENNIKYETYLAWVGKINELRANLPATENTRISDLFGREVALEAAKNPNNYFRK